MPNPMRRADRQITDDAQIDKIISDCDCCRLGLRDEDGVYIVPMNFGFMHENGVRRLYFHCAGQGRKLAILRQDPRAGFELDSAHELVTADSACGYSYRYQSVIGTGEIEFLHTNEEKAQAFRCILSHYTNGRTDWSFNEAMLARTTLFCLRVTELTAKAHR